jgi:hypothetical protein
MGHVFRLDHYVRACYGKDKEKNGDIMRTVRVKVGKGGFALKDVGDIIEGQLICEDEDTGQALIYFPEDEEGCGCVGLYKRELRHKEETWIITGEPNYINLNTEGNRFFEET